jgi:hypothetical protein
MLSKPPDAISRSTPLASRDECTISDILKEEGLVGPHKTTAKFRAVRRIDPESGA